MAAGREGVARAEEKMMARLQSEVLIEATQTIRLNQILEAKVFDLEKRLRWSEEERLRDQRYSAAREEDVILLKDECRIMKSMTMNHLSKIAELEHQLSAARRQPATPEPRRPASSLARHSVSSAGEFESKVWERVPSDTSLEASLVDGDTSVSAAVELSPTRRRAFSPERASPPPKFSPASRAQGGGPAQPPGREGSGHSAAPRWKWGTGGGGLDDEDSAPAARRAVDGFAAEVFGAGDAVRHSPARVDEVDLSDSQDDDEDDIDPSELKPIYSSPSAANQPYPFASHPPPQPPPLAQRGQEAKGGGAQEEWGGASTQSEAAQARAPSSSGSLQSRGSAGQRSFQGSPSESGAPPTELQRAFTQRRLRSLASSPDPSLSRSTSPNGPREAGDVVGPEAPGGRPQGSVPLVFA